MLGRDGREARCIVGAGVPVESAVWRVRITMEWGGAMPNSAAGTAGFPSLRSFDPAPWDCGLPCAQEVRVHSRSFPLEARVNGMVLDGPEGVSNVENEVDVVGGVSAASRIISAADWRFARGPNPKFPWSDSVSLVLGCSYVEHWLQNMAIRPLESSGSWRVSRVFYAPPSSLLAFFFYSRQTNGRFRFR